MLRSFQYAAYAALYGQVAGVTPRPDLMVSLERGADYWSASASASFLRGYVHAAGATLPKSSAELRQLLDVFLMEKALYEISYELNNRPDWVRIPLSGILKLLARK
jgi:maltose alpha-D-glucosyltransferase/alpha-amylase